MAKLNNSYPLAYCTNVHAGSDLSEVKNNLESISLEVKRRFSPNEPMGIGLWISNETSLQLENENRASDFGEWLGNRGLIPFTFNGFPFGDFHQSVVKHKVYEPTWATDERLEYTIRLANILHLINSKRIEGSISTLPLGWPNQSEDFEQQCAIRLIKCAEALCELEASTGRLVYVCIEPEPGCCFDTAADLTNFFNRWIFRGDANHDDRMRRYLRVCHDICHSAVMFEEQSAAISIYREAGIQIGKVQVSSAVEARFDNTDESSAKTRLRQLREFDEPKYLHQTCICREGSDPEFYEDLNLALDSGPGNWRGVLRTHFHVPIFLESFGELHTTRDQINDLLLALGDDVPDHFEIETYAWNVFPGRQKFQLSEGIARELAWFRDLSMK